MNEIGHSFDLGRNDDATSSRHPRDIARNFERYSGGAGDDTVEQLSPGGGVEWSIMARTSEQLAESPMQGRYFAYSLEELLTAEEP